MATKVPLAEISFCVCAAPVIICGSIRYADHDSLVTTVHPEIIPCSDQFLIIVETTKHVWVTITRRVEQIATPPLIHEKVSKKSEDQITTLYTPDELQLWEDYNSFPSYMKSSHQKILNSLSWRNVLATHLICWEMSSTWKT